MEYVFHNSGSFLYFHRESNSDLIFRRDLFYPLNYGSICMYNLDMYNVLFNRYSFSSLALATDSTTFIT